MYAARRGVAPVQGDLVVVRDFRGRPLIRRVWAADARGVYITDDVGFERLKAGQKGHIPVGFPREDVFEYDARLAPRARDLYEEGNWDWSKLRRWEGGKSTRGNARDGATAVRDVEAGVRSKRGGGP